MTTGAGTLAKRKATKGKPDPGSRNVAFKCSAAYVAWLDGFARSNRTTVSAVMDQALAELAKARGYEAPPERID
jgi:hypothetical protein